MGNVCGSTKTLNNPPTHHRLGSASESAPQTVGGVARPPAQARAPPRQPPQTGSQARQPASPPRQPASPPRQPAPPARQPAPPARKSTKTGPTNDAADRERRAQAAEERLKAATARGTNAANPKQGQLAAKVNKPVAQPNQREEEPLRWD